MADLQIQNVDVLQVETGREHLTLDSDEIRAARWMRGGVSEAGESQRDLI